MLLQDKNAIIYGGGPISGAVAQAFAREGASVFLAGRNQTKLAAIAETIALSRRRCWVGRRHWKMSVTWRPLSPPIWLGR
jgi:NAD(P)-dependent dehydrogenase (short-subunit alcohol dehydrogenase family)